MTREKQAGSTTSSQENTYGSINGAGCSQSHFVTTWAEKPAAFSTFRQEEGQHQGGQAARVLSTERAGATLGL